MTEARPWRRRLAQLSVAGVALLVAGEVALRLAGLGPLPPVQRHAGTPDMNLPDEVLGWRNRPGDHSYPADHPLAPGTRVSVLSDGSRDGSPPPEAAQAPQVLVLGGSFTQGFLLDDADAWPAQLQQRLGASARVVNLASPGYGGVQALLLLEQELAAREPVGLVVYGFVDHHEVRSAATFWWLRGLRTARGDHNAATPWVGRGPDGALGLQPPISWPQVPLSEHLAVASGLEVLWGRVSRKLDPTVSPEEAGEYVVRRMAAACAERGVPFVLASLVAEEPTRERYRALLAELGGGYVSCDWEGPEHERGPDGIHPIPTVTARWADCVASGLEGLLPH
jgi:hypothetical protein